MDWRPPANIVWTAIDAWLALAYEGQPPAAVRSRLDLLKATPEAQFFSASVFETTPKEDPIKYSLRLGNRFYPHMKLVVERSPDGQSSLLRADTHDRHIQLPAGSPEAAAFADLSNKNQTFAQAVEAEWDRLGLPTFKRYLRDDLARRRSSE